MLLVSVGLRFLYPGADSSQSSGLAVVSSSGARYYLQDGQWHPIANRTSARPLGDIEGTILLAVPNSHDENLGL